MKFFLHLSFIFIVLSCSQGTNSTSSEDVRISKYCFGDTCAVVIEEGDLGPPKISYKERTEFQQGSTQNSPLEKNPNRREMIIFDRDRTGLDGGALTEQENLPGSIAHERTLNALRDQIEQDPQLPQRFHSFNSEIHKARTHDLDNLLSAYAELHKIRLTEKFQHIDSKYRWQYTSENNHPFTTSANTAEGQRLNRAHQYVQSVRNKIDPSLGYFSERQHLLDAADASLEIADEAFQQGMTQEGQTAIDWAEALADTALSLTPGIGCAKDVYESLSGLSLISGKDLSTLDRSAAFFGAASFGLGSKVMSGFKVLRKIVTKLSNVGRRSVGGLDEVAKIITFVKNIGFNTGRSMQDFVKSSVGKIVNKIRVLGKVQTEYGYKIFRKSTKISNHFPANGKFARIMPKQFVQDLKAGKARFSRVDPNDPTVNEAFITAADELSGLSKGDDIVKKLSLFSNADATQYRNLDPMTDVIVEFKFKDNVATSLRSPTETANNLREYGFIPGGKTGGGAREWLIDGDAVKKGYID